MTTQHETELPTAVNRILLEHITAGWRLAAMRALLTLGAFEELVTGPLTVDELAARCGADPAALRRVLRCVAATGLIHSAGPDSYELTDACRAAMDGWPFAMLRADSDPELLAALGEITQTVRTGKAPFIARHGSVYGYLATRPETAAAFDTMMEGFTAPVADALAQAIDFSGMGTVVDVGGGYGRFAVAILRAHPGVRGIVTELGRAVPGTRDYLAASGVADRCDVVACDFFADPLPRGSGAYLLAHVIHNWDDEQALKILRAVRAAVPGHGRLLLVEAALPDDDSPHPAKDNDIRMLTVLPGGERTKSQYAELLVRAGFRMESVTALTGGESAMVAAPAGDSV